MYNVPGSMYRINDSFEIFNSYGKVCNFPTMKDPGCESNKLIKIKLFDQEQYYSLYWLRLVSRFDIYIKECLFNTIFVDVPYKRFGEYVYIYHKKPIYVDKDKIYRYVPGICRVGVSKEGVCVDTTNMKLINGYINPNGYKEFTIYIHRKNEVLSKTNLLVHRLVASSWIYNDSPIKYQIVNHIDGNKLNNHYKNLEWTTYKGNADHAVNTGLIPSSNKCYIRDIITGEIFTFASQSKAKEFLGISGSTSADLSIAKQRNFLFKNRYELRINGDTRPWFYENVDVIPGSRSQFVFKVTDAKGKITLVNGIKKMIEFMKLDYKGHGLSAEGLVSICLEKYPNYKIEIIDMQPNNYKNIQALNVETKEVELFSSINQILNKYNLPGNLGIRKSILENGARIYNGYRFRYESNDPWPEINTVKTSSKPKSIDLYFVKTGEVKHCKSIREAASILNCSKDAISRMLNHYLEGDICKVQYSNS